MICKLNFSLSLCKVHIGKHLSNEVSTQNDLKQDYLSPLLSRTSHYEGPSKQRCIGAEC
jgi:hypothetical protein